MFSNQVTQRDVGLRAGDAQLDPSRIGPEIGFARDREAQHLVVESLGSLLVFDRDGNKGQAIADSFVQIHRVSFNN
jgi:hypothetical protein